VKLCYGLFRQVLLPILSNYRHGFGKQNPAVNNASSTITTSNEQGVKVSVGWARPQSELVDWLLIVEQSHAEAWKPIIKLRNILLACVFGTFGLVLLVVGDAFWGCAI
jgi:osomolarity two-component system sensor histidine kinase SLN1